MSKKCEKGTWKTSGGLPPCTCLSCEIINIRKNSFEEYLDFMCGYHMKLAEWKRPTREELRTLLESIDYKEGDLVYAEIPAIFMVDFENVHHFIVWRNIGFDKKIEEPRLYVTFGKWGSHLAPASRFKKWHVGVDLDKRGEGWIEHGIIKQFPKPKEET